MWRKLYCLGMPGVILYVLHVALGGFLWEGYNHLTQPISDLTATGAPHKALLSAITLIYGLLCIVFAFSAYAGTRKSVPKVTSAGLLVFFAMHLVSITYGLFPEDLPGSPMTFTGLMHIVVTALIVPLTILAPILAGAGLRRVEGMEKFGLYSIITGVVIFAAGGASVVFMAQKLPLFGLVERINIGTLQLWTFLLSVSLLRNGHLSNQPEWAATGEQGQAM